MKKKRTRQLLYLSIILFVFFCRLSYLSDNFTIKYPTKDLNKGQLITYIKDSYTTITAEPRGKSPVYRILLPPVSLFALKSAILFYFIAIICFLNRSFLVDVRQKLFELIPSHFYGSKYSVNRRLS